MGTRETVGENQCLRGLASPDSHPVTPSEVSAVVPILQMGKLSLRLLTKIRLLEADLGLLLSLADSSGHITGSG